MNPQPGLKNGIPLQARVNPVIFANHMLGVPLHPGQVTWIKTANKKINILRPGNRWGKTLTEAILHIWHCICKPLVAANASTDEQFFELPYDTLNFAPGYEQAREVLRTAVDLVEGRVIFPEHMQAQWGRTNDSLLKGWAIVNDKSNSVMLPEVEFMTGAKLLGRSYSDMGAAFKAKAIPFISGDECADIDELWTFTNVTLLPRLVSYNGILHFVGTVQPDSIDYQSMIEMAEEDMKNPEWKETGMFYVQKGSMYENTFLPRQAIEDTERIADETLRQQIIYGEAVQTGNKYFGSERILNGVDNTIKFIEKGFDGRLYLVTVDFAGGASKWSDFTVIQVWDYTEEPYRLVYQWRIKGNAMPIPMQYKKVEEVVENFSKPGLYRCKLIIDATALGGANALAFLRHLNPIPMKINGPIKAEMISTLKVALDGGQSETRKRKIKQLQDGTEVEENSDWGLLRYPNIPELIHEMANYKLDDKKIRTDMVMCMAQAIYWIEMRRPKIIRKKAVEFNLFGTD